MTSTRSATTAFAASATSVGSAAVSLAVAARFVLAGALAAGAPSAGASGVERDGRQRVVMVTVGVQWHLLADRPLDVAEVGPLIFFVAKGNGNALGARPVRPMRCT